MPGIFFCLASTCALATCSTIQLGPGWDRQTLFHMKGIFYMACNRQPNAPFPIYQPLLPALIRLLLCGVLHNGISVAVFAQFDQAAQDRADNAARDRIRQIEDRWRSDPRSLEQSREQMSKLKDQFEQERWIEEQNLRELVLLPPMPPSLAETQPDLPPLSYPAILADYAGEPFFMAFGQLYFQRLLKPVLIERIEKYRRKRDAIVVELRTKLTNAESLNPNERHRLLGIASASQQEGLNALEAEAEAIRRDLASFDRGKALAKRRDSEATDKTPGLRSYLTSLFAAHYDDGLSVDQRQLLHEIALHSLLTSSGQPHQGAFFLPASARLQWPRLPATASNTLERFNALKTLLRDELIKTILSVSRSQRDAKHPLNHSRVAASQAPQFAELERLAEELRLSAAELPHPDQPKASEYPHDLVLMLANAMAAKSNFRHTSSRTIHELNREFAPAKFKVVIRQNQPTIEQLIDNKGNAEDPSPDVAHSDRLTAVNLQLLDEHQELTAKLEVARLAVSRYRESLSDPNAPSVSQLSASIVRSHEHRENWHRFADYRTAVLTPGLSPAQRRLLFNAALRDLEKYRLQAMD